LRSAAHHDVRGAIARARALIGSFMAAAKISGSKASGKQASTYGVTMKTASASYQAATIIGMAYLARA